MLRETSAWGLQDVLFKNKDSRVSQKALHILTTFLDDSDNYTRRAAFWSLYWVAVDENDHDPELQKQVLTILASHLTTGRAFFSATWVMGDIVQGADDSTVGRHAVESLIPLLDPVDQAPLVRRRAAEALGLVVTRQDNAELARQAVVALVPLVADEDRGVRDAASRATDSITSFFPKGEVVESAIDVLTDPQLIDTQSATVRGLVITAIGRVAVKNPTPALSQRAMNYLSETVRSEDDPNVLLLSVRAMSSILSASGKNNQLADLAISALTPLLGSPNSEVRSEAVSAIGDAISVSGDPNTAKAALKLLTSLLSDDAVQGSAESAFREARATLTIEDLIEGLDRPEDSQDRLLTIEALFLRALRDPNQLDKIESGLSTEMSQASRKAHVRIDVAKVRELLEIARCVEAARRNPDLIPQIRVYLFSLTGHVMDHVSFAAWEAISEFNRLDVAVHMDAVSENPELIEQTRAYLNWLYDRGAEGSLSPRYGGQYPGLADEVWLDIENALRELDRMEASLKD
jgi:HEAT repeat protein